MPIIHDYSLDTYYAKIIINLSGPKTKTMFVDSALGNYVLWKFHMIMTQTVMFLSCIKVINTVNNNIFTRYI